MADIVVQALKLAALPRHFRTLARHLHFHLSHLLHERFFVFLQLPALFLEFFVESQQLFFARRGRDGLGLELLDLLLELPDQIGLVFLWGRWSLFARRRVGLEFL